MTETMPPTDDGEEQARRLKRVGAYAKLLANYASDDAIIDADEPAELLFVRGLAFCATSDADGYITHAQVTRYVGAGMKDAAKRAERLAKVGLWLRVDGGYLVRSWTKIHETAESKGRRRKADRERKRRPDSEQPSEPIPGGIPEEDTLESLSMTEQCSAVHDTTAHDTTEQPRSLGEERTETLRVAPVPEHAPSGTPTTPADARCTKHRGVADPGPCKGCQAARESAEAAFDRETEQRRRLRAAAILACPDCNGSNVLEDETGKAIGKCSHPRVRVAS